MNRLIVLLFLGGSLFSANASTLIATNSTWKYLKGTAEASTPDTTAWRNVSFSDTTWLSGQEPFYYENDPPDSTTYTGNTLLSDMFGGYTCIFMRQKFVVSNLAQISQLQLTALSDDGFIAWINGTEVARFNMPAGNIAYNGVSSPPVTEPVPLQINNLLNPQNYLVSGTNVLTIQAFNASLGSSSDFLIWAGLTTGLNAGWTNIGISEFMATNQATVADVDGEFSPWIELFNPTANDLSLNNWSLTVDTNNLRQWVFPNITLETGDVIVVFASGKNRTNAAAELHTNFRPPVSGGNLLLLDAATNVISSFLAYPAQTVDVSYGRDQVTPGIVGYFSQATPADYNSMSGTNAAPAVTFSRPGGTFTNTFGLQLTAISNAAIYYTLDGTVPSSDSARYTNTLAISNSVQVRARSFLGNLMPGALHSETYLQLNTNLTGTNSNLPAIVVYNYAGGVVPDNINQIANVAIYEPTNGITSLTNLPSFNMRAGIHLHGSTSTNIAKRALNIEFHDEVDGEANVSPLGMPPESDWILYAPDNFEPVLMHNALGYQLCNDVGPYAPRTRFVELYINTLGGTLAATNYNGIYLLEEKIKWDKNRVDIQKIHSVDELHPLDNTTNVSGGYMMKLDRLGVGESGFNPGGQLIVYDHPNEEDIRTPQRAPQKQYLLDYMVAFTAALNGANYTDPTNGYRPFVHIPSWIDTHIVNVTTFNLDALRLSAYFYKDRNGPIHFGPVWDFDRSQGSTDGRDFNPRFWRSPSQDFGTDMFNYGWWGRMFTDIDFWQAWIDRYQDLRTGALSTNHIFALIDGYVAQIQQEQPREVARWPTITKPRSVMISSNGYSFTFPGTYQGEITFLKQWYADRLNFMDTNFVSRPVLSNTSGVYLPGGNLGISSPDGGTIYYTTNNTDPRLPGGGISANAFAYGSPIALSPNLVITARALNNAHHNLTGTNKPPLSSSWSGPVSAAYSPAMAPVITQAPADADAYLGQTITFTVLATGNPAPRYQWTFHGNVIGGQTNAQYSFLLNSTNASGAYGVTVSNLAGTNGISFNLNVTPRPNLVITEAMSSESKGTVNSTLDHQDWWELSNLGNFPVNLRGFRFDDSQASLSDAVTLSNAVSIAPGESIVLVQDMTPAQFIRWWGATNLPASLQVVTYPSIGFSAGGDSIYLWNAFAVTNIDKVASATFLAATRGVSFGYNPSTGTFGALSVAGNNGAFAAVTNGDIGSPGTLVNFPVVTQVNLSVTNGFGFNLNTQPNRNYQIQYKQDLTATNWLIFTNFTALSNSFTLTDPGVVSNAARYYRAVLLP